MTLSKIRSNSTRWSEKEWKYSNQKQRIFDRITPPPPQKSDYEPLYSSFNKNCIFIPPPSSKESLGRQRVIEIKEKQNKSVIENAGKSSHRLSAILSDSSNVKLNLVNNEQTMFKRVQSSYGSRKKTDFNQKESQSLSEYDSTKAATVIKGRKWLSIRSGAFRN